MEDIENPHEKKRLIAKSTAFYRGVAILETGPDSFVIVLGVNQHKFVSLSEATAFIDAFYAKVRLN